MCEEPTEYQNDVGVDECDAYAAQLDCLQGCAPPPDADCNHCIADCIVTRCWDDPGGGTGIDPDCVYEICLGHCRGGMGNPPCTDANSRHPDWTDCQ